MKKKAMSAIALFLTIAFSMPYAYAIDSRQMDSPNKYDTFSDNSSITVTTRDSLPSDVLKAIGDESLEGEVVLVETITDRDLLEQIIIAEGIDESKMGTLESREIIRILPSETVDAHPITSFANDPSPEPGPAPLEIRNLTLLGHTWYREDTYTPYTADGPGELYVEVSKTGSSGWDFSGTLDIKSILQVAVGYKFGESRTIKATYKTAVIPEGSYAFIKVHNYFTKHSYEVWQGTTERGTGEAWRPNDGLHITCDIYRK